MELIEYTAGHEEVLSLKHQLVRAVARGDETEAEFLRSLMKAEQSSKPESAPEKQVA